MRRPLLPVIAAVAACAAAPVLADDDDGWRRHGPRHWGHAEYRDRYREGGCKVERRWDQWGGYREKRKCRGPAYGGYPPYGAHYAPAPHHGYGPVHAAPGVWAVPGGVVIQPPAIVVR